MRRAAVIVALCSAGTANAEVLDKQPSVTFLVAAAVAASFLAYAGARRGARRLALLGLLPALVFVPALLEQVDPVMRPLLLEEGGHSYLFAVWFGPASVLVSFGAGLRHRSVPPKRPLPAAALFLAVSVAVGLALSSLSGLSAVWACLIVAVAMFANGIVATVEDRNA